MAISWMQRHKKWLIVTIWISTIAFVGAGFVGWGSYNYGKSDGTVAIVGDKEVPMVDVQSEYNGLYSQYQQLLGDKFNQEMAKQFGLEQAALQKVIQKYLLINYANEIGLIATDDEVARELVKIQAFYKDGKFDKNTYIQVLKENRRTATEFEAQLKQDLLVAKVQKIFTLALSKNEIKNLSSLLFSEDKVSVKVINSSSIKVTPKESDLKAHWEKTKDNYKTPNGYEIKYTKIDNEDGKDKKAMKKVALKAYLKLKKDKQEFKSNRTIYEDSTFFNIDNFAKLKAAKDGQTLKPLYKDGQYYVVRLVKKIKPQALPYKDVKSKINKDFIAQAKQKELDKLAKEATKNFKGSDIGYITRASTPTVKGLSNEEVSTLVQSIFNSTKKVNFVNLGTKVVVYEITDTKLASYDAANDFAVVQSIEPAKVNSVTNKLLEMLQNKYEVKSYMKSN